MNYVEEGGTGCGYESCVSEGRREGSRYVSSSQRVPTNEHKSARKRLVENISLYMEMFFDVPHTQAEILFSEESTTPRLPPRTDFLVSRCYVKASSE